MRYVLTSIVIIFRGRLRLDAQQEIPKTKKYSDIIVLFAGLFLGIFVTLSSVGAGALVQRF